MADEAAAEEIRAKRESGRAAGALKWMARMPRNRWYGLLYLREWRK